MKTSPPLTSCKREMVRQGNFYDISGLTHRSCQLCAISGRSSCAIRLERLGETGSSNVGVIPTALGVAAGATTKGAVSADSVVLATLSVELTVASELDAATSEESDDREVAVAEASKVETDALALRMLESTEDRALLRSLESVDESPVLTATLAVAMLEKVRLVAALAIQA